MMKQKYINILTSLLIVVGVNISTTTYAQQNLNETLTVEGEYDATIRRQERINTSPTKADINLPKISLPFASSGVTITESPEIFALPITGWQTTRQINNQKGYFELGIGSYLNIAANAGYLFINNEKSTLGVTLQHNSSSLFSPFEYNWENVATNLPDKSTRKRSDSRIALYGSLSLGSGILSADIDYHYGYFNYYGLPQQYIGQYGEIPTQQLNDFQFNAKWLDKWQKHNISYNIGLKLQHFGYRNAYGIDYTQTLTKTNPQKENHLTIIAGVDKKWNNRNTIGVDVNADLLFYSNRENELHINNYTNIRLTPYYSYQFNNLNITAGANIDIISETSHLCLNKTGNNKFSGVHISPDINLGWRKSNFGIYLHALGGMELNTLASNYYLDYYQSPTINSSIPIYSPIDGRIGLTWHAFPGFSADISFAYKITNNTPLGGTYLLNSYIKTGQEYADINIKGFSIATDLKYKFMNRATIELSGSYQPQNCENGYFNGYDRPRWILNAKGSVNIWKSLDLSLSYQYRGVRNLYYLPDFTTNQEYNSLRLDDIYLLNVGVSYRLLNNRLTIWGEANNLLNSTAGLSPLYETEGFNFMLGVGITF